NDVFGAGAGLNVGYLKRGGRKRIVAVIPVVFQQLVEQRQQPMQGIVGILRVGDMALAAADRNVCIKAAATAVFDGVTQLSATRRFAEDAIIDVGVVGAEPFDDLT